MYYTWIEHKAVRYNINTTKSILTPETFLHTLKVWNHLRGSDEFGSLFRIMNTKVVETTFIKITECCQTSYALLSEFLAYMLQTNDVQTITIFTRCGFGEAKESLYLIRRFTAIFKDLSFMLIPKAWVCTGCYPRSGDVACSYSARRPPWRWSSCCHSDSLQLLEQRHQQHDTLAPSRIDQV